jgi:NitT/TauT family transport system permease protein
VAGALGALLRSGALVSDLSTTLLRLCAGYALALALGIPLGLLLARSRFVDEALGTPLIGLQSLPSICWLPVAVLWFGPSEAAILFVVTMGSVLAIALASQSGVRGLNPLWLRAARTLGARGLSLYTTVLLPASLPALLSGARLGWAFAWRALMAAELLHAGGGLGQQLQASRAINDVPRMFAVMAVIVAAGMVVERAVFVPAEAQVRRRFGTDQE